MKSLCIIPARGGSKRIPGKNIRNFCGKPIIAYSIEAAIESNLFSEIMVSTDDKKIADIAIKYGAKVPFLRSKKNSNDFAGLAEVLLEVIKKYKDYNRNFDDICCILPTAPFITSKKLIKAKNLFFNGEFDCVFPVVEYSYPIQRSLIITGNCIEMKWPKNIFKRTQDLEPSYHDAGQFYLLKVAALLLKKRILVPNSSYICYGQIEVQDIDSEQDWKIAEIKYKLMYEE